MIPWARSSIRDPNYMASKVVAGNVREFSLEDLREWLEEERDELYKDGGDSIAAEIQNLLEDDELSIADVYATGIFDEVPRCEVLTREFLGIIEALKDGGDSIAAEIQNLLEDDELSIADVYATGIFDEVPRCEVLTREFLGIIEALRWFFEKTKETE
jgi:hypothetical protein